MTAPSPTDRTDGFHVSTPRSGLAAVAMALAPLPLGGAAGGAYMAGHDGFWLGLGVALGIVLAGTLLAAPAARSGSGDLARVLSERFGGPTAAFVTALLAPILVLLLAGQLAGLADAVRLLPGVPGVAVAPVVTVGALLVAIAADARPAVLLAAAAAAVAVASIAIYATAVVSAAGAPIPFAYGNLLQETSRLELDLLGKRLADVVTLKAHATPYLTLHPSSYFGALLGAAAGTALLALAAQLLPVRRKRPAPPPDMLADGARGALVVGLVLLLPVLVLMPALAVAIKTALYKAIATPLPVAQLPDWVTALSRDGLATICGRHPIDPAATAAACKSVIGNRGLLRLHDLDLDAGMTWFVGGRIAGLPPPLAMLPVVAAVVTALAAAALSLSMVRAGVGGDRGSSVAGRAAAVTAAMAALAFAMLAPEEATALSWWVLPLAAALLPVPLVGLWWRRATSPGAVAGVLVGVGVTLYYLVGTRYFAVGFYDLWQTLSPASLGAERKLVSLRETWAAADGPAKAAAWQALVVHARSMASWWGVKPAAAALFGVPAGLVVMILLSLATRRPGAGVEAMLDRAHTPGTALGTVTTP